MHGRGVVRSAQESANLRAYMDPGDVAAAESIKTAKTATMPGVEVVRLAERLHADGGGAPALASGTLEADKREGLEKVRIVSKSPVYLYGMRPIDEPGAPDLAWLSPYEFPRYWRVGLAACPRSEWGLGAAARDECQATLTPSGAQK
eukprot:432188-Pyramimonas_sp.AAC.2